MIFQYRGWIPTVTGRLSFSHFGDSSLPRTQSLSRTDGEKLYLLALQRRTVWDVMLPAWGAFEFALQLQGRAWFVCSAETQDIGKDRQGALAGTIYIISDAARWNCIVKASFAYAIKYLAEYSADDLSSIESHFSAHAFALNELCDQHCAFKANFYLKRNGVAEFRCTDRPPKASGSPEISSNHLRHVVMAQAYSFLRDLGHKHQHHSPTTDTIIDLHEVVEKNDMEWRLRTLYGMYRKIITLKRKKDILDQISSTGLLAYAKAFKRAWNEDRPQDARNEIPKFYDDAMKESIQASELRMRFKLQQSTERWSIIRTVSLSVLGLALSFAGLVKMSNYDLNTTPSSALIWTAKLALKYPYLLALAAFAISFFFVAINSRNLKPERWQFFRYLEALTQSVRRRFAIVIYVSLGAIGFCGAAYIAFGRLPI